MEKYRIKRVSVLLRRSARYVLVQRGFGIAILAIALMLTVGFTHWFATHFPANSHLSVPIGAGVGILVFLGSTTVQKRINTRLDRTFFRSAYDASRILQQLTRETQRATSRQELASLLEQQIHQALHPQSLYIYLQKEGSTSLQLLYGEPAHRLKEWSLNTAQLERWRHAPGVLDIVGEQGADTELALIDTPQGCLVPLAGREGDLLGLMILGERLSEESYSHEDKRLLVSVATQSAMTMDNIRLAEQIAERLESERVLAHEMALARQVQSKLLPQKTPALKTLDYWGECNQARAVGGDYYDFLSLPSQRLAFILADVAGKGIAAALLMANLQATLRSYCSLECDDCLGLLPAINRLFCQATESNRYATFFFGEYDDVSRRLRYANCGHNPAVLLHNGKVQRLEATATVLGLFDDWTCSISEVQLAANDILVIYTDGFTEATDDEGEEFGEARLIDVITENHVLPPRLLCDSIIAEVKAFSRGIEQQDDMTAIVVHVR